MNVPVPDSSSPISLLKIGLALFVAGLLLWHLSSTRADPDMFGYMSFAREWENLGEFPMRDPGYSYMPTNDPWVYHEWLTGVILWSVYKTAGGTGLQGLKFLLGFATYAFLWLTLKRNGAPRNASMISLAAVMPVMSAGWPPVRAQCFTYPLFALTLFLLIEADRRQSRTILYWLIPLHIFWANAHGAFVAGLGIVVVFGTGVFLRRVARGGATAAIRESSHFFISPCLAGAATLLNPYGLDYWTYLGEALKMPRPAIHEWHPLFKWAKTGIQPMLLASLGTVIGTCVLAAQSRRFLANLPLLCVLLVTFYLSFKHARHLPLLMMPAAIGMGLSFRDWNVSVELKRLLRRKFVAKTMTVVPALAGIVLIGKTLHLKPWRLDIPSLPGTYDFYYPVAALDFMEKNNMKGNIIPWFGWAEYVTWRGFPDWKVSFGGRYETLYASSTQEINFDFYYARPGWRRALDDWPTDYVLLVPQLPVVSLLRSDPDWKVIFEDQGSVLIKKDDRT